MHCYLKTKLGVYKKHDLTVQSGVLQMLRLSQKSQEKANNNTVYSHPLHPSHIRLTKPVQVAAESVVGTRMGQIPEWRSANTDQRVNQGLSQNRSEICPTTLYPVQLDIPPDRARVLYFSDESQQKAFLDLILREQGYTSQIDQYWTVKKLGSGASSIVSLAQHKSTDETFAMKIIDLQMVEGKQLQERYMKKIRKEIELHGNCKNSQNVVRLKESFIHDNFICIVMEYMEGGDLQQLLARRNYKPFSIQEAQNITFQTANALKYLHTHQIIHRDIKLENVMLGAGGGGKGRMAAKLADFGLAEKLD